MTRRWLLATPAVAVLALLGCTAEDDSTQAAPTPTASSTSASPTSSAAPSTSPSASTTTSASPADLVTSICTDGIAEADDLVLDATNAARAGTRSPSDIADYFRRAQDLVTTLAARSDAAELGLSSSLQGYAAVLGQVRLNADVGVDTLTQARQAVSSSCVIASAPPT